MLRLVVGDDSELSRTVYTHTRRVIFPLPLRVLQSPATRNRSWPSSRETLRIASPLVLLWIHAVEESKKLVLPSRELAYSRFLTRNLFVPSKNREKIVDNDAMKVQVTKVMCRRVRYRVWIQVIPTREEDLNSMRRVMTTDHRFLRDERQGCTTVQYFLLFVKHAATVNYPEGGWGWSCQATNHTVKPLKPRPPRYLAPVSQGLVSCQQQSRAKWLHDVSPSFSLLFPFLFILFFFFPSPPLHFIRLVWPWIELNSA